MAKTMPKLQLNLDGSWLEQLDEWVRQQPKPLPFSADAVDRARYGITIPLTEKPDSPSHCDEITVRQVITMNRGEISALPGVGPKTMEVVDAFLTAHGITELGPVHEAKPPSILAKEAARLMTNLDDPDVVPPGPPIGHEAISMPDFDERRRL